MMTYKEFYAAVIENTANEEVKTFAQEKLNKLNERSNEGNEKRSRIMNALTDEFQTAEQIAEATGLSRQTVSSNITYLIKAGSDIEKSDGLNEKGKAVKVYRLAK